MRRLICISTGNLYVRGEKRDINKEIAELSKLDVDGIELLFPKAKQLLDFRITESNLKFLRKLKFNTIHSPFHLKFAGKGKKCWYDTPFCRRVMEKMREIYDLINAKNINFHPDRIKNFKLLEEKRNYQYSIENMEKRVGIKDSEYKTILKKYPHLKMVLDVSHASEWSKKEAGKLAGMFGDKIIYIHSSINLHQPLHLADKRFLKQLEPIKKLDCPIVIETWTNSLNIEMLRREVDFVRKWVAQTPMGLRC